MSRIDRSAAGKAAAAGLPVETVVEGEDKPGAAIQQLGRVLPRTGHRAEAFLSAGAKPGNRGLRQTQPSSVFGFIFDSFHKTPHPRTRSRRRAVNGSQAERYCCRVTGGCFDAAKQFALPETTVRTSGYDALDRDYSDSLSEQYWDETPHVSAPDPTARGFGEFNAAGYPKNQYVRPYMRRDGTMVSGYWRNSPSDGLPTCRVTSC